MHNRRNQVATKPRSPRGAKIPLAKPLAKPAPGFPCDIAIPPHRGASTTALLLPIPGLPARVAAQPLFALPEREPPERLRTPASSKPSKASTKPRKTSAKRRKPGGKGRKAKAALARPDPAAGLAAFALPRQQEPLVTAKPAPPPS
ncbi:MAG: hypothetical protein ABL914_13845, partial [Novosphingobium sp.]|uniref:hypothetical protein n=1 Tax=Novosphingobium sp. TaxID=1874826 RepID=UPI0032BBA34C